MEKILLSLTQDERDELVAIRHAIHADPELAFEEFNTANRVEAQLRRLGLSPTRVAGTGVIADIGNDGPMVALRADLDALPIHEDTPLPFKSKLPGKMHACGHDIHTAWLLGAAAILRRTPLPGRIRLIFQPAEETMAGAAALIDAGVLAGVSAIFGAHVDRYFQIGEVVAQSGTLAASSDRFDVVFSGRSAHGARPHQGVDAIVVASQWVSAVQTIASRGINPAEPVVISIGTFNGGTAANVIADRVMLSGTIRTISETTRETVFRRLSELANGIATAHGALCQVQINRGVPPIVNTAPYINWCQTAATIQVGESGLRALPVQNMASEDFALYLQSVGGAFIRIGVCEPGANPIPAHSPQFYVSDDAIPVGAGILAQIGRVALDYLRF